jgi:hypothetical protein
MKYAVFLLTLVVPALSHATTWGKKHKIDDPVQPGQSCVVQKPRSYGSYIYHADSKYDLVFWPLTDARGLWHCKHSGFVSLGGDFSGISEAEQQAINQYLGSTKAKRSDTRSLLERMEAIYQLRSKSDDFDNRLLRVLARWHQQLGDDNKANAYRAKALSHLIVMLDTELPLDKRMEYLYVAANYSRQLGQSSQSDAYLEALSQAIDNAESEQEISTGTYFRGLMADTLLITEGGKIEPPKSRGK